MTEAEFIDNPRWAEMFEASYDAPRQRSVPAHEDCSPVEAEGAAMHLKTGGTLGVMPGYEERPGQIDMLKAIVRAYNEREHLMIEAGTGVGKSLAYLIPSILWSHLNDTPVVISTATRNLQSQLVEHDIPRALSVLGDGRKGFKVSLLKGRGNYLCLKAVDEFFESGYWTMSKEDQAAMPAFIDWLKRTKDGDLDLFDALPRSVLTLPGEECPGRHCPHYARCFVYRARKRAAEADLVIANHALVIADAASAGEAQLLPPYGRLVLDEAHNLEAIATDQLSKELSMPELMRILNRLERRSRSRMARRSGVFASVARLLARDLVDETSVETLGSLLNKGATSIPGIVNAAEGLFDVLEKLVAPSGGKGACRYRVSRVQTGVKVRQHSVNGIFENYDSRIWSEADLAAAQAKLETHLASLVNILHSMRSELVDRYEAKGLPSPHADLATQIKGIADAIVEFANMAAFVVAGEKETYAYWGEFVHPEKRHSYLRLVAAPLSVAGDLEEMLYKPKDSVILSSATLRVGRDFKYMMRRLGCGERFRSLTAPSPFDYLRQTLVLAPECMPDPSSRASDYVAALSDLTVELFRATRGRALALFTSYEMMNSVAQRVRDALGDAGIHLIVQGEGVSREAMAKALKDSPGETVLFGAQSFWEGVDVAGEALSCVLVARLPFAQRTDPIVEARSEKIEREGLSSFRDYYLPEAVIKFRQGFGRLVRSRSDRGVVVVADSRIVTKNYGASFRHAIPASVHSVKNIEELTGRVNDFFSAL